MERRDKEKDQIDAVLHLQNKTKHLLNRKDLRNFLKKAKKPFLFILGIFVFIFLATPIITYLVFIRDLSSKESIMVRKNSGVVLTDRNDKPFFTFYEARANTTAELTEISDDMENAVIASEDKDFYNHPGFSLRGIFRAVVVNLRNDSISQGGSTISQQLIKNTLLSQNRNLLRKYQELILALELERKYSKKDILEMYLNTVYFGEGAFGIHDASETYFNKTPAELTLSESAMLAGILPAPSAFSPISGDETKAYNRRNIVLTEMRKEGYITVDEEEKAKETKLIFSHTDDGLNQTAPHFALMVKNELIEKYGEQKIARSGYTVKTTLDLSSQEYAETVVKNQVMRLAGSKVTNGAAVAIDPKTGEILVLVGSWDYISDVNGKINMATRPRQPGSSFKPIVYAKAFENRTLTPGSIIEDKETTFSGNYKPKNYDGKYRGNVTVRRALANSLNIPAVKAIQMIGVDDTLEMAERLGIETLGNESDYGYSLALGAGEIPLIQMTSAFSVFANKGDKAETVSILEIKDKKGNSLFKHIGKIENVLSPQIAFLISSILSDNNARAEVFGGSLTISRPAAVKTGTTENYRDSLTIGYTPNLVVGAWVGNNDNTPMNQVAGSSGAAPIWRLIMENMLSGTPIERFTPPTGLIQLTICKENGFRTDFTATSSAYPEYFLRGTQPSRKCDISPSPSTSPSPSPQPSESPKPSEAPEPTDSPTPTDDITPTTQPTSTGIILPTI